MKKEKFLNNNQQHIELGEIVNIKYKFCVKILHFPFSLVSAVEAYGTKHVYIHVRYCVHPDPDKFVCVPVLIASRCMVPMTLFECFFLNLLFNDVRHKREKSIRQFYVSNSVYAAEKCTTISSILLKVKSSRNNRKWESTGQCILLRYKMKEKKTVVAYA